MIRIIPDVSMLYARHYRESSHCLYLYSKPEIGEDGHFSVYFSDPEGRREITDVFPEFRSGYDEVELHGYPGYRSTATVACMPQFAVEEGGTVAGQYYLRPHASGLHRSLPVLFATMFILSNVVRYKPDFWMDVIEGRRSGSAAMAEAVCNLCEHRFPNDALNSIWQEQFTFGAPGYLT